jgi:hypothetical protein
MAEDTESPLRRCDGARTAEYVKEFLPLFLDLQARTDPTSTEDTAKGKNLAALRALEWSGRLVEALAGWAIDHQIGLASEGLAFVPLQPSGTKDHPQYLEARADVDDHRHEYAGAALRASPDGLTDPTAARRLVINLLRANPGGFPPAVAKMLMDALQDLEYGRVHPLLAPNKASRKVSRDEQQLQLSAVAFINYRVAHGKTKARASQEVADAYGVSREAILTWEKRLREELGSLAVSRRISFARNAASWAEAEQKAAYTGSEIDRSSEWDERYGEKALQRAAQSYRAVQRQQSYRAVQRQKKAP